MNIDKYIKTLKNSTENSLSNLKDIGTIVDYTLGDFSSLWDSFSFFMKIKWIIYNKVYPFKKFAILQRKLIEEKKLNSYLQAKIDFPDDNPLNHTDKIDYPNLINPAPKSLIVSDLYLRLNSSLDFISVNLELFIKGD